MPDRSIWVCPSRYRRLSTASVASLLRQNSKPAIADNALFLGLLRASQVYICRKTFGYLLSEDLQQGDARAQFALDGQSKAMRHGLGLLPGAFAVGPVVGQHQANHQQQQQRQQDRQDKLPQTRANGW